MMSRDIMGDKGRQVMSRNIISDGEAGDEE